MLYSSQICIAVKSAGDRFFAGVRLRLEGIFLFGRGWLQFLPPPPPPLSPAPPPPAVSVRLLRTLSVPGYVSARMFQAECLRQTLTVGARVRQAP